MKKKAVTYDGGVDLMGRGTHRLRRSPPVSTASATAVYVNKRDDGTERRCRVRVNNCTEGGASNGAALHVTRQSAGNTG